MEVNAFGYQSWAGRMTPSCIPGTVHFDVSDIKYSHSSVGVSIVDPTVRDPTASH